MNDFSILVVPLVACLLGLMTIPLTRRIALRIGFVDSPDKVRKLHASPIPLGGGIAVWLVTWFSWWLNNIGRHATFADAVSEWWFYGSFAIVSLVILGVGIVDDRFGMRGCHKLIGQLIAAALMVGFGTRIDSLWFFGIDVSLGVFSYPITVVFIVVIVNAFNLIDGMDGFCGLISLVTSLAIAFLAFATGRLEDGFLSLSLAGSLIAFLKDNLPPAKIYLGDAGSLSIGWMISILSLRVCSSKVPTEIAFVPLLALLALPLLDVLSALGRRWLSGHSLFMPDRGHIHHRLRIRFHRPFVVLASATSLASFGACGGLLSKIFGIGDLVAILALLTMVVLLVGTDTFGGSEFRLFAFRLKSVVLRFLVGERVSQTSIRHECHLQGVRDWAILWDTLIQSAEGSSVSRLELAINMPALGETYHGHWDLSNSSKSQQSWSVTHSLFIQGTKAGVLRVSGSLNLGQAHYLEKVEHLVRIVEMELEIKILPPTATQLSLSSYEISRIAFPNSKV